MSAEQMALMAARLCEVHRDEADKQRTARWRAENWVLGLAIALAVVLGVAIVLASHLNDAWQAQKRVRALVGEAGWRKLQAQEPVTCIWAQEPPRG